ncbi:prostaglandin G/H synthase 2-like [Acyrthosiphon pisum]|uniref:Uncharacterized protein n=1 Tax=Acyrthosiphon pisum TaxID=7029 RepID=A0A8R2JS76_ACYPI|nr:prostaglandin G/H synthase 2-like [Acyrthosiphon pisum]
MIGLKFKHGDEILSMSPLFFVLSTLWVREHNRVCDELSRKSPSLNDTQLYRTARKIVTGQMMTIMMNEILNVELRPKLYHHRMENISGFHTPIELFLTMAVSSLPEELSYCRQVSEAGLKKALEFMVKSKMGMVTAHNDGVLTECLTKTLITLSRSYSLQGFNNYRRLLGLPAYNSFLDLTGNHETATKLKNLYGTVDNVELLTGIVTERSRSEALPTAKVLSNSFIINAILTNDLTAKHSWVPYKFGGIEFFELVERTSLESLVYRNVDVNRDELQISLYAE